MKRGALGLALLIGAVALVGGVVLVGNLVAGPEPEPLTLVRPAPGAARADHLPDGTPVWVIGHENGSASVISGFATHRPFNIGKLLWWCERSRSLDDPAHGSHWDEYGRRLGGPAPSDLPTWDVRAVGSRLVLGARQAAPPEAVQPDPADGNREWCFGDDPDVVFHTFDGWELWTSPQAAVEAAPADWILIEGTLETDATGSHVILCAREGCADAAIALAVELPEPGMEADVTPLGPGRFIAQVRDGALLNLTRVVWTEEE